MTEVPRCPSCGTDADAESEPVDVVDGHVVCSNCAAILGTFA